MSTRVWRKLEAVLAGSPSVLESLRPPISEGDLIALQQAVGKSLPEEWVQSARVHDGQDGEALLDLWRLLPAQEVLDERSGMLHLMRAGEFQALETEHDRKVGGGWWREGWLPVASNGCGDLLCIDLDPGPKGKSGQIIEFIHDDALRRVVAASFEKWLQRVAKAERKPEAPSTPVVVDDGGQKKVFRDAKAAQKRVVRGGWEAGLRALEVFTERGDGSARSSVTVLKAYLGDWDAVLDHASLVVLDRETFGAMNVPFETAALLARAGAETGRWKELAALAPRIAAGNAGDRLARCVNSKADVFGHPIHSQRPREEDGARLWEAYEAAGVPSTYSQTEASRLRHRFLMAVSYDRRSIAQQLLVEHPEVCEFADAVRIADWADPPHAWKQIIGAIGTWHPICYAQVAPVELLTHPLIRTWMTSERCRQLLSTPRARWWWERSQRD